MLLNHHSEFNDTWLSSNLENTVTQIILNALPVSHLHVNNLKIQVSLMTLIILLDIH